ncbi:MAG TPA: Fe-Mn family superoxide dismutase [Steroidobacteraceae bacterium]|nr:Fe-Mn family superoxide dismutase [Steroidobacteraceae bacterium]
MQQRAAVQRDTSVTYKVREFNFSRVEGISSEALQDHLTLYKGYVENTNRLLKEIEHEGGKDAEHRLAFEFNGMKLHELFFETLGGPGSAMRTSGVLAEAMDISYGGTKGWRDRFLAVASTRGIGWVMSAREVATNRLLTFWIDEHHFGLPANLQPVILLDCWEHAYLKDFGVKGREEFVETVLHNLNWSVIEKRCS